MKCYIAGKLNAEATDYIKNVHKMIIEAEKVRKLGFAVYVPCIDFLMGVVTGTYEYYDYFDNSQPWLLSSDVVYVLDNWETSSGTKREIELAIQNKIPVVYNLDELVKLRK